MWKQEKHLTTAQRADVKHAFDILDTEARGYVETKDLKVALRALGFEPKKDEIKLLVGDVEKRRGQKNIDGKCGVISIHSAQQVILISRCSPRL